MTELEDTVVDRDHVIRQRLASYMEELSATGSQQSQDSVGSQAIPGIVSLELNIIIMPPPNGLEAYMFSPCPPVRPSVCPYATFFSAAITKEPISGLT